MMCLFLEKLKLLSKKIRKIKILHCILKIIKFPSQVVYGLFITALFFYVLSHCSPSCYRKLTDWANNKLLPLPRSCIIKEIASDDLNFSATDLVSKRYQVTIMFDTEISPFYKIFIYDRTLEKIIITPSDQYVYRPGKDTTSNILEPIGGNFLQFNAITQERMPEKSDYVDCPFRVMIMEGNKHD